MLNISLSNSVNTDIYYINPGDCGDLTGMLGGNTDISKLDTTPRQDITLEFGEETNEPTKSETINYEEIYYEYLINNFEIAELVDDDVYSHSSWNEKMHGLISATIYDFNNDDILELLTVSSEKSPEHSEFTAIYLNLYQYNSENVVFVDKIGLNEYSADGQSSDSVRLSISGNAIYQEMDTNGRYASMGIGSSAHEYSVISVSDYSFNKYSLFTDTVNIIDISQNSSLYHNGVYDNDLLYHDEEKCNQLKSEQWYYCDNKHCNYNLDYILNTVQNKYSDFGLAFSSLNIDKNNLNDCITVSTSLEGAVPLCSLERMYPKLEIIDYTNLRGHISARVIDYEEIYYSYIENELIPKYGLASLNQFEIDQNENNSMPNTSFGIVSADIADYDDDNSKELIVLTLELSEQENFYCDINLHLYSIEDNKVQYADSEYLYGYQMHDIHSDNFFTLDKCNNELLFTNNVCYFSGEAASSNVTIIKIVNRNFVSENMTTSDYEGETLYVNGNEVCNSNDDINYYETAQRIISQKLMANGFLFDNVEYKGRVIDVSVTNNTKIAKYSASFDSSSVNWFSVIIPNDYTNLREYITAPATPTITDISGRYSNDKLFVDVIGEIGSEGNIRVEYVDGGRSYINYQGMLSENLEFFAEDGYCKNSYKIKFYDDKIDIKIYAVEYINVIDSWSIPEVYETLERTSKKIPDYNISSWTDEMIVKAINNYLKGSSDWKQYAVFTSDIYGTRVMMRYQGGMEANTLTEYFVAWGYSEDFAHIALQNTGGSPDAEFHLTEYLNAEVSSTNKVGKVVTENDALNVRQLPSTESNKIGTVGKGSTVIIRSEVDGWYEIEFNGNSGYVSGEYVQIVE